MMHYYTPEEFVADATLEGGVYWLEADGAGGGVAAAAI